MDPNLNAQQIKSTYKKYSAWNDPASILADYKAGNAGEMYGANPQASASVPGATSAGYGAQNVVDTARQLQSFQTEANKPAIETLQKSQGSMEDRYKAVLDSIKGQGSVAANAQTLATSNELGRRGILPNTGVGEQQIASALLPVTTQYAGLTAQTGLQQQQQLQDIVNNIAQLQAGNPLASITGAQTTLGAQQQGAQFTQNLALQQAQQQLAQQQQALAGSQYQNVTLPQSRAQIGLTGAQAGLTAAQAQQYDPNYLKQLYSGLFGATPTTGAPMSSGGQTVVNQSRPTLQSFVK